MSSVQLTTEQFEAVYAIIEWWNANKHRVYSVPPVFKLAGYAGVGKSTVVKYAIEALELDPMSVGYVTFTGKAALVLQSKGCFAQTIHRLIYQPILSSYIDKPTGLKKQRVAGFELREELERPLKLLVIDEVSMVSPRLLADLMSFGIPILAIGDPAQLPPVRGQANGLLDRPDAFLETIHRQAADNPILWASMQARNGRSIPYGRHGSALEVMPLSRVTDEMMLDANQVITCTNKDRTLRNTRIRAALGHTGSLPNEGEKLICLKNNWDEEANGTPLVNGLLTRVDRVPNGVSRGRRTFYMDVTIEGDPSAVFYALETNLDYFEPVPERPANTDGNVNHFDYGYAITCHKSQGSEWDSVVFVNNAFGDHATQRQLLYTGITRAAEKLVLAI